MSVWVKVFQFIRFLWLRWLEVRFNTMTTTILATASIGVKGTQCGKNEHHQPVRI